MVLFGLAITMDGTIVADYIATGILNANLIKAGVLSSVNYQQGVSGMSINLLSGAIDTANFKANTLGEITATAGQVGGFTLSTNEFSAKIKLSYTYTATDVERLRQIIMGSISPTNSDYEKYDLSQKGSFSSRDLFIIQGLISGKYSYDGYFKLNTLNAKKALQILDSNNKVNTSIGIYGSYFHTLSASDFAADSCEIKDNVNIYNNKISMGKSTYNGNNTSSIIMCDENSNPNIFLWGYNGNITCVSLTQTSLKSKKKNIKKLKVNALELIKNADICSYNFKNEKMINKKHIGLVIDKDGEYNCPREVISEDEQGVEQYSMISLAWKAIQELIEENSSLKQRTEKLEKEVKEFSEKGRSSNS